MKNWLIVAAVLAGSGCYISEPSPMPGCTETKCQLLCERACDGIGRCINEELCGCYEDPDDGTAEPNDGMTAIRREAPSVEGATTPPARR